MSALCDHMVWCDTESQTTMTMINIFPAKIMYNAINIFKILYDTKILKTHLKNILTSTPNSSQRNRRNTFYKNKYCKSLIIVSI